VGPAYDTTANAAAAVPVKAGRIHAISVMCVRPYGRRVSAETGNTPAPSDNHSAAPGMPHASVMYCSDPSPHGLVNRGPVEAFPGTQLNSNTPRSCSDPLNDRDTSAPPAGVMEKLREETVARW